MKIFSDDKFIVPEYKIDLLNKSKKIINTVENINPIVQVVKSKRKTIKTKKGK